MEYEIDRLDRQILQVLQADSRKPFLEIARELKVSGGTIHARMARMREVGIVKGSKIIIDYEKLGFSVSTFVGIKLARAGSCGDIQERLREIPEIVEVHYTTGAYSLLIKIVVPSMRDLYKLLSGRLQNLDEIQSTETFIILNTSLDVEPAL
jgi:Lrp/AsnC family transcriptional regulator, regulator for asnA, asnC and gidA